MNLPPDFNGTMPESRPITIAVVIPKYGLVGGAEGFVFELTERLAGNPAFEIHVLANRWRRKSHAIAFHKVPILNFPRWIKPLSFAFFSNRLIQRHRFDVVHSHERIFSMDLLTFHGIPHQTWVRDARRKRLSLFDRATAWVEKKGLESDTLRYVLPVSGLVKEELLKIYPQTAPKIRISHPGVSMGRFDALDPNQCRREIRRRHGLSETDVVILFVGMNFGIKRLGLVMRGIGGLAGNLRAGVKLLVVGKGDEKRYRQLAGELGIGGQVVFTGVKRHVEPYYLASDIFAMPSRFDTFGLAVLEAMAAGLPVIVSGKVGARDLVSPGIHGQVLTDDPSDADMTAALAALVERETRRQMGENARQAARDYTWERAVKQVASLYRQVAGHVSP